MTKQCLLGEAHWKFTSLTENKTHASAHLKVSNVHICIMLHLCNTETSNSCTNMQQISNKKSAFPFETVLARKQHIKSSKYNLDQNFLVFKNTFCKRYCWINNQSLTLTNKRCAHRYIGKSSHAH